MKRLTKLFGIVAMVAMIAITSVMPSFATSDTLKITGDKTATAKVGDTVTYELFLGDCKDKVEGMQASLFYNSNYLKVKKDSLKFKNFSNVISNTNIKNYILFNWTDVQKLADFSSRKSFVSVDFTVKKAGKTDISYYITDLYGDDMTYLKNYTFTYNIKVNKKTVVKKGVPTVNTDTDVPTKYKSQGSFKNYMDGKGEKNGSGKNHVEATAPVATDIAATSTDAVTDVTKGNGSDSTSTILIVVVVIVVILGIIIAFILRRRYTK